MILLIYFIYDKINEIKISFITIKIYETCKKTVSEIIFFLMSTHIFNFNILYNINFCNSKYFNILLIRYFSFKYFFILFIHCIQVEKYFIYYFSTYLQLSDGECDFI